MCPSGAYCFTVFLPQSDILVMGLALLVVVVAVKVIVWAVNAIPGL